MSLAGITGNQFCLFRVLWLKGMAQIISTDPHALQMMKGTNRDVVWISQGHTASPWQNWEEGPGHFLALHCVILHACNSSLFLGEVKSSP